MPFLGSLLALGSAPLNPEEKLLRELIALPSVNPAFLAAKDARSGEKRVAEFLAAVAARAGLACEFSPALPNRPNLLIRYLPETKARQRVILAPHLDTVGEATMAPSLFDPMVKNGRLYGRGACDTKGSVAAMFSALAAVAQSKQRPRETEIVLAALVDEENAQSGSRALIKHGFTADLAIIGEPTQLQVVTAHKGDMWLQLETRGRAAHGARPELGVNAVHEMARVVDLLETRYARQLRQRKHPLLGAPTVNVGSILGGRQPNIVPDRCVISIDRRTVPGESNEGVQREIKQLLRAAGFGNLSLHDFKDAAPCFPMETNPKLPLVQHLLATVGQEGAVGVAYFSDASVLSHGGIPSVLFGPGNIAQAHTANEWISLRSLERGTHLLKRFLQSLP